LSGREWDRVEKTYAVLMYLCEAAAVACILAYVFTWDIRVAVCGMVFTVVSCTLHVMLLVYNRTRTIIELLRGASVRDKRPDNA